MNHGATRNPPGTGKAQPREILLRLRRSAVGTETLTDCDRGRAPTAEVDHTESYVSLPTAPTVGDYNSQKPPPEDSRMRASLAAFLSGRS